MSEATVQVPAVGKVKKQYVYVIGAAVVGFVAYAWWKAGMGGAAPEAPFTEDTLPDNTGTTPPVVTDPRVDVDNRVGFVDNAGWSQAATDRLIALGYDGQAVSNALGKFLQRQPLTAAEATMARAALGQLGQPPQYGPWQVIEAQTPAAVGVGAPTGFRAVGSYPDRVVLTWNPVTGAVSYEVRRDGGGAASHTTPGHTSMLPAGRTYTFRVRARNAAGQYGPETVLKASTAAQGGQGGGSGGGPAAPRPIARASGRARAVVGWPAVPGATSYRVRREGSGPGVSSGWVTVRGTSYTATARFRRPTQVAFRVQSFAGSKPGGNAVSNPVVIEP